jgi:hypothetical protein
MQLNNISYSDRNSRPVVLSKVGLQAFFISDGQYVDPYQISSVTIFSRTPNLYPSSILNEDQLIDTSAVSGLILMNFANSASLTSNQSFEPSNYTAQVSSTSGVFKTGTGKYIVILDGTIPLSGVITLDGMNQVIPNRVSATGDYLDVWTVTMVPGSLPQTVINDFTLRKGGFTVLTEPLMIKAKSKLINNKVTLGSKVDIKIATDIHVENTLVDSSIKNLLRENVISNASLEIQKLNDAANIPARVTVSSFSDTSSLVTLTGDNVVLLTWDTNQLKTHSKLVAGEFGSIQGIYAIRAKYTIFNEIIVTDPMYLTLS